MLTVKVTSSNTDPIQYKPWNPHFQFSFEGQDVYTTVPVPAHLVVREWGTKKHKNYELSPEGIGYVTKYIASALARVNETFNL